MVPKDQVAARRDAAFSMKLGSEADGKLVQFIPMADGLYTVAERAIYKALLADTIDPDRAHLDTPNVNQKVASSGADSKIVQRTLLQAACLLSKPYFHETQSHQALGIVLGAMQELLAAETIFNEFKIDMEKAEVDLPTQHQGAMNLPAVGTVETRTKAFVQRAEHCLQSIFQLAKCFLGDPLNAGFFDGFAKHIAATYPVQEEYMVFAKSAARFATMLRNTRHCIEHPKENQRLDLADYHIRGGKLHQPEIEIIHRDTPMERMPLHGYMELMIENLVSALESVILFLAANYARPLAGGISVGEDPDYESGTHRFGIAIS